MPESPEEVVPIKKILMAGPPELKHHPLKVSFILSSFLHLRKEILMTSPPEILMAGPPEVETPSPKGIILSSFLHLFNICPCVWW